MFAELESGIEDSWNEKMFASTNETVCRSLGGKGLGGGRYLVMEERLLLYNYCTLHVALE